jgi:hypothetical protein
MTVPGIIYSLLLAIAAWAVEYFSTGAGAGVPWAPILIAAIPVILKLFTAAAPEEPEMASRGVEPVQRRSYVSKVLLG